MWVKDLNLTDEIMATEIDYDGLCVISDRYDNKFIGLKDREDNIIALIGIDAKVIRYLVWAYSVSVITDLEWHIKNFLKKKMKKNK